MRTFPTVPASTASCAAAVSSRVKRCSGRVVSAPAPTALATSAAAAASAAGGTKYRRDEAQDGVVGHERAHGGNRYLGAGVGVGDDGGAVGDDRGVELEVVREVDLGDAVDPAR